MRQTLAILSVIIFSGSVPLLNLVYPNASTDYDVFIEYYYARERINELLIAILFLLTTLSVKGSFTKAVCVFGFTVSFSSMIDKIFLQNFHYLYSDVVIVAAALILSFRTYKNGKNPSRTERPIDKDNNPVTGGDFN